MSQETRAFWIWIAPKVIGGAMVLAGIYMTWFNSGPEINLAVEFITHDQIMGFRVPTNAKPIIGLGTAITGVAVAFWEEIWDALKKEFRGNAK